MLFTSLLAAATATLALAAPAPLPDKVALLARDEWNNQPRGGVCDPSKLIVPLPAGQTAISIPPSQKTVFATVGRGVQNYTCKAGKWESAGALADLYDISCLLNFIDPSQQAQVAEALPQIVLDQVSFPADVSGGTPRWKQDAAHPIVIKHDFTTLSTMAGIFPRFAIPGGDFATGSKVGDIPSPDDPVNNIVWLQLVAVDGGLSKTVFRTKTVAGVPSNGGKCSTEGDMERRDYAALYYFLS